MNNRNIGYISLHRQIEHNWLWFAEPFSKGQAWVDLLLLASHSGSTFFIRGNKIDLKTGEVGYSKEQLASRWKWSRKKVLNFLKMLEKEQQIIQRKTPSIVIVELVNYASFQKKDQQTAQQKTNKGATEEQQENINNNETIMINNEIIINAEFEKFWNLYNYKKSEKKARESFDVALTKTTFEKIIAGIDYTVKDREGSPEKFWICPVKWLDNERWNDSGSEKVPITIKATQHTISAVKRTQIIVDHCKKNLIHPDSLSNEEKQNIIKNNK